MNERKQITFDLDTNVLKQIHGEKNYTKAYTDIKNFMEHHDFEHIEGSVYASKNFMSYQEVVVLIKDLKKEHEYLDKSVRDMHQTDVGETHSLGFCFDYDGTPGKFAQKNDVQNIKSNIAESIPASQIADYRKQITFDLDTNILKQIHGEKNYTKAYRDIRSFMESNDFEHIEGSAYASKNVMSNFDVLKTIDKLKEKHAYLNKSVKELHQTDIVGTIHSMTEHFDYDGTPGKYAQKENQTAAMTAERRKAYLAYLAGSSAINTDNYTKTNPTDNFEPL